MLSLAQPGHFSWLGRKGSGKHRIAQGIATYIIALAILGFYYIVSDLSERLALSS